MQYMVAAAYHIVLLRLFSSLALSFFLSLFLFLWYRLVFVEVYEEITKKIFQSVSAVSRSVRILVPVDTSKTNETAAHRSLSLPGALVLAVFGLVHPTDLFLHVAYFAPSISSSSPATRERCKDSLQAGFEERGGCRMTYVAASVSARERGPRSPVYMVRDTGQRYPPPLFGAAAECCFSFLGAMTQRAVVLRVCAPS